MIFTYEGKEYEFRGEYRRPQAGDSFLNDSGRVSKAQSNRDYVRGIVHPIPKTHTFGGVVFEEVQNALEVGGQWYIGFSGNIHLGCPDGDSTILKQVRIE